MNDTDKFSDEEIFARTIYGEARGEPDEGKKAVANVILNRVKTGVKWWGHDARTVCLKPFQFSCWLKSDPNRSTIMAVTPEDAIYVKCAAIAADALGGRLPDNVDGATSYYAKSMAKAPTWAYGLHPCAEIGNHLFFRV